MNNVICCQCLDCGNEFIAGVPELLEVDDQSEPIGELVWCGLCDSHDYECYWGVFSAGHSRDKVEDVIRLWREWSESHHAAWRKKHYELED